MAREPLFEWEGIEYEREEKSTDWYWALGIVATAAAIASVLFGNYLLALLVVVAAVAIALHAAKEGPVHRFALTEEGLLVGNDLHPYKDMRSFCVLEDIEGELPPVLSVKTHSILTPHLMVSLAGVDAESVYNYLFARVSEAEHRHSLTDLVAAWLGF